LRADLVPFGPPRLLAGAALAAGLTPGEAAREILAGCPVKIALAWLLCIARKRRRLRCPGAVFRAGCRTGGEPSLADLVDADRLLRGAAGELLPRGSMPAHSAARVIVGLAVTWAANAAVGPAAWRVRRAELEAAAAAERQAQLRRLRLALPRLSGAERARAERVLAAVA
jgi:hypothetical protein